MLSPIGSCWWDATLETQIVVFNFNPAVTDRFELFGDPVMKLMIAGVGNKAAFWNDISILTEMSRAHDRGQHCQRSA